MDKIDLKKTYRQLYLPSAKEVVEVEVPEFSFLMIDGEGDPNTSTDYANAVEALFAVAYAAKFLIKKKQGIDYGVMPLEGLWWADDMAAFAGNQRDQWRWIMMIMQPDFVTPDRIDEALASVKKNKGLSALSHLRLERFAEGRCAQILHIGPFSEEGQTIERVHRFIEQGNHTPRGKHHEIYLSDIRRTAPEKWKTVIRQPLQ